jgi:hypothetical protein
MMAASLIAALTCAVAVSAHGFVSNVTANGETHEGFNPAIAPWLPDQVRHNYFHSERTQILSSTCSNADRPSN